MLNLDSSLAQHRQQFPALSTQCYFNYGGQGPMPQGAIAEISSGHEYMQTHGPFSNTVNAWAHQQMQQVRGAIAAELQISPTTLTLTENVTVGCNIALWGLDWQAGDHILLSDCEHPGVVGIVRELARRFDLAVSVCPLLSTLNHGDPVQAIAQHLRPETRLVVISHILWNTGQVLPLAEIVALCHGYAGRRGQVRVLVDAAQSVGVLPLDLGTIAADFYAFTGHKWLCGPAGIGGLYVSPNALADLRPTFIGWRGVTKDAQGNPIGWLPDGRRFEVATSDVPLYGAMSEAIATHQRWGSTADRYRRICHLSRLLWEGLAKLPQVSCLRTAPPEAGLVSFQLADCGHAQAVQTLEQNGFLLRTLLYPDCIRACVHYFTLESEIERLLGAIAHLVR
ncbi:aminotransferase class V-fold PLP-dependent enzyme [Thermoleptolyngbya sp. PKUAC-SCTB121]|uniref:aminotransferase class V-fold PLP-dependent enzyme n=1 Tax=Thermoleptolyngbya sp. PKUAC-SCTB121 TaxID=2811482 RepID=UPI00196383B6|nr:aminotransferase class V-fold PLP-dependent enzyme [Thermoleptolyngbya sp. PKUAC-SCTB121]